MIYYKLFKVSYSLSVLLLLVPLTVKQAQAAPIATSATVVNCIGTIDGTNVLVPGLTSSTCSVLTPVLHGTYGSDADAYTTGWIGGDGTPGNPFHVGAANVSAANTGSTGGSGSASAQLLYFFDLVLLGAPAPAGTVTINIEMKGSGSGHTHSSQARTNWGVNETFTNELITNTSTSPFSVVHTIDFEENMTTGLSPLDWDAQVWLTATCGTGGGVGATCDAKVDPIFTFADPNDAQFYAFNFSPNLGIIPVPAAVWLFGSGLIGLIGIARRKKA